MIELSSYLKAVMRIAIFFLSASLVVWIFFPEYRSLSAGFILGTLAGMFNAQHLAQKVRKIIRSAAEQKIRNANTGFVSRAAIVFMAAVIAIKFPEKFSLITMLIGVLWVQLATLLLEIAKRKFQGKSE